jgi:signal transduction histidine kinase
MVDRISILMTIESRSSAIAPLSLAEIVKRVVERKRGDAARSEIELGAQFEPDLPLVLGDVHQLEQAVESLIENALKFTPGGGSVKVEVYAGAGCVCLAVADSGIGISSQELECIFAPFYQLDGSTRRQYGGLGLGLTLIKAVVEAHGGWVEADSQLGQGSHFVVRLPACGTMPERIGQAEKWQQ